MRVIAGVATNVGAASRVPVIDGVLVIGCAGAAVGVAMRVPVIGWAGVLVAVTVRVPVIDVLVAVVVAVFGSGDWNSGRATAPSGNAKMIAADSPTRATSSRNDDTIRAKSGRKCEILTTTNLTDVPGL